MALGKSGSLKGLKWGEKEGGKHMNWKINHKNTLNQPAPIVHHY